MAEERGKTELRHAFVALFFRQQVGDSHEVVRQHRGRHQQFEPLTALSAAALHATAAEQHGDAPLDAGSETLPFFEDGTVFVGLALGSFLSAALWDTHDLDASLLAGPHILLAVEAPIRTIQYWGMAEGFLVALQRGLDMIFVAR